MMTMARGRNTKRGADSKEEERFHLCVHHPLLLEAEDGGGGETIKLRIVPFHMERAGGTDAAIMRHCLKLNFARTSSSRIFLFRATRREIEE